MYINIIIYTLSLRLIKCVFPNFKGANSLYRKRMILLNRYYYNFFRDKIEFWNRQVLEHEDCQIEDLPIWVCWLQGKENLPKELQITVDSIYKHSNSHLVKFIDYRDIVRLVDLPSIIRNKYISGQLSSAHFCDYARCAILYKYGGLWLDPTVLVTKDIQNTVFSLNMWSVKGLKPFPYDTIIPDACSWQIYAMASQKGSIFYKIFCDMFVFYVKKKGCKFDYFFSYYISFIIRNYVRQVSDIYNCVPNNNVLCESLQVDLLNHHFDLRKYQNSDTYLYKFSRHDNLLKDRYVVDCLKRHFDL